MMAFSLFKKLALSLCLVTFTLHAQHFQTNALRLPIVGVTLFDRFLSLNTLQPVLFNTQIGPGVGYQTALLDYSLWYTADTQVLMGKVAIPENTPGLSVSVWLSNGLRYNFADQGFRPFMAAYFDVIYTYYQGFLGFPLQIAFRPKMGVEWIFGNEIALELGASYVPLINFVVDPIVRHKFLGEVSFNLYF